MKIFDIHTKQETSVSDNEWLVLKKHSQDFIISIPHSGTWIPTSFKEKLQLGRDILLDTELYTDELYNLKKGTIILTKFNPYLVNMNRPRQPNLSQPAHLQKDPLHTLSLTGKTILLKEQTEEEKDQLLAYYDAYHSALKQTIQEMKQQNGYALIFDCHALNSKALANAPDKGKRPDFDVGTFILTSKARNSFPFQLPVLSMFGVSFSAYDVVERCDATSLPSFVIVVEICFFTSSFTSPRFFENVY